MGLTLTVVLKPLQRTVRCPLWLASLGKAFDILFGYDDTDYAVPLCILFYKSATTGIDGKPVVSIVDIFKLNSCPASLDWYVDSHVVAPSISLGSFFHYLHLTGKRNTCQAQYGGYL